MANTIFQITELDFDLIKSNQINFFQGQTQWLDYNFTGSGLNVLMDVLAYNTHYNGFYANMVANEMYLDSAVIRDSVVSRAKALGYVPSSKKAPTANIQIVVTPPFAGNNSPTLTLPAYSRFLSEQINGINYPFITLESYTVSKNLVSNVFTFPSVTVVQGEVINYNFAMDGTLGLPLTSVFIIPDDSIDTSTLTIVVQASATNLTSNTFIQANDVTQIDGNSQVFFLEETYNGQYGIYFGDGFLGAPLSNGNIVLCTYISTDGSAANSANQFTPLTTIGGPTFKSSITTNSLSVGGSDRENIESIRFRAPIGYIAQGRATTEQDYKSVILKYYGNFIDQISVWGGQDNLPVVYGQVFISIKPKTGFAASNTFKNQIISTLVNSLGGLGIIPNIVDPTYLYVLLQASVNYDPSQTTLAQSDIQNLVSSQIVDFAANNFGQFGGTTLKLSRLGTAIDETEQSIIDNDITVFLQKQLIPTLNVSQNYTLNFYAPLHRGGPDEKLYSFPAFNQYDNSGILRQMYIEEVPESFTGLQAIQILNPGIGYTRISLNITGDGSGANGYATIVNGKLATANVDVPGFDYSLVEINIDGDGYGAILSGILNQQIGYLRSFYFDSVTGNKIILNNNVGTIDYINGIINLYNLPIVSVVSNPFYLNGVLTFNIRSGSTGNQSIAAVRNSLVELDATNPLSVQVIANPISSV